MKIQSIKDTFIISVVFLLVLVSSACSKEEIENKKVLDKLYDIYKNGQISKCKLKGEIVYSTEYNAYDAGGGIYDKKGKLIGSCNYAWGNVDEVCKQVTNCEIIYMVKDNIWQQPAVDKYNLGR